MKIIKLDNPNFDYEILFKCLIWIHKISQYIKRVSYLNTHEFKKYLMPIVNYIFE